MARRMCPAGFGFPIRSEFDLDFSAVHLNHGSFGAAPRVVLQAQSRWRDHIEKAAGPFFQNELPVELKKAGEQLSGYMGAAAEDLVFVENATTGIMSVLTSVCFKRGDQILIGNQTYDAVRNIAHHVAARSGAAVIEADLPFPVDDADEIVDAFAKALTERTRIAVVDHVASSTAVCIPAERLVTVCRDAGVSILIDGAHAPGMLPLDLSLLGADWYVGNCHKWLFAPRGCAFLWAHPSVQQGLHPAVVSHGWGRGFAAEFEWTGTRDPSAYLAIPAALDFRHRYGEQDIVDHNHFVACEAATRLARRWRSRIGAPSFLCGSMAVVALPERYSGDASSAVRLRRRLWHEARIDVPILSWGNSLWARLSAQIYNAFEDYERFAEFIVEM